MSYIDELKAIHPLSSYPCATEHALTGIHLGLAVQEVDDLRTEVERLKLSVRERRKLDGSFAKQHKKAMDELRADLAALTAERDELRKDKERNLESDSIVASCDCQVKTNEIAYHKPGCKYRLICERDNALALIIGLQTDLSEIQRIAAFDLSDMVADRIFQYCKKPLAAIDAARATPPGGAGENAGARREEP